MTVVKFTHGPETILFAIDLDPEMTTEDARGRTRLDVIRHAITAFVQAKTRMSARHRYGLITIVHNEAILHPSSLTSNTAEYVDCLHQLQAAEQQQFISSDGNNSSNSRSSTAFDMGSLFTAAAPLMKQQQQQQGAVQQVAGGTLSPLSPPLFNSSSSRSSQPQQQQQLRVILFYGRSCLPAPILATNQDKGLALDCVYVHDKPQAGLNNPQEVYSALEELVDGMALIVGHAGFIYETTAGRPLKLLSCMAMLLSHPSQRRPQVETKPPGDLATVPLMLLPSDAANLSIGVPVVSPGQLPAASAWSKPLTVTETVTNTENNTWALAGSYAAREDPAPGGASSSSGVSAWGMPAGVTAAAAHPWTDPWNPSTSTAFGSSDVLLSGQTQQPVAPSVLREAAATPPALTTKPAGNTVTTHARRSSSSSNQHARAVAIGVPAGVVPGIPDRRPSYSLDDSVAMGFVVRDQASGELANLGQDTRGASGASSNSSAAAAAAHTSGAGLGAGVVDNDVNDGLDDLAAVLRATAVDDMEQSR